MDEEHRLRLRAVITASDQTVAEEGASADPVAQRRVMEALARKAGALGRLGSYEQRIAVWDEIVRCFADDPPPGRPLIALQAAAAQAADLLRLERLATALEVINDVLDRCTEQDDSEELALLEARSLGIKRDILARLGRELEAVHVDDETVGRFADAQQLQLRSYVNGALARKSRALLQADLVEDALEVSRRLLARIDTEPDETLGQLVTFLINDLTHMMRISGPNLQGAAWTVTVAVLNCGSTALEATARQLARAAPLPVGARSRVERVIAFMESRARRRTPKPLAHCRQRFTQALAESEAIISRLDGCDDPQLKELAAVAQIAHGMALIMLGHPKAGMRTLEPMTSGERPGAIQAWQQLATWFAGGTHNVTKLGAASALSLRADALAAGDPQIARIAYDDSLHNSGITDTSRFIKLLARVLRPGAARKPRVWKAPTPVS